MDCFMNFLSTRKRFRESLQKLRYTFENKHKWVTIMNSKTFEYFDTYRIVVYQ